MRDLIYYVASTVDGFIARPDGSFDHLAIEGEHLADLFHWFPETIPDHLKQQLGVGRENRCFDIGCFAPGQRPGSKNGTRLGNLSHFRNTFVGNSRHSELQHLESRGFPVDADLLVACGGVFQLSIGVECKQRLDEKLKLRGWGYTQAVKFE